MFETTSQELGSMWRGNKRTIRPDSYTFSSSRMRPHTQLTANPRTVKHFETAYRPELAGEDVVFTDYELVATNQK